MKISPSVHMNMNYFRKILRPDLSFDVVERLLSIGGRDACLYFVDGLVKDDTLLRILQTLEMQRPESMPSSAEEFARRFMAYGETTAEQNTDSVITQLLSGTACLMIDGYESCLVIDCRTYPSRGISEPEKNKVLRGARDGFVETLIFNTALIRRRIRDPRYRVEYLTAGESSRTDIAVCYMEGRADEALLNRIRNRIKSLQVDALTMSQESLAECIYPHRWFNPFPKFRFSERPDTTAASILEGSIALLVDTSPAAMILPSSIFDIIEEADDYYFPPITGTYLRLSRLVIFILTLFLTPVWLLLLENPQWIPGWLSFIRIRGDIFVPVFWQLMILEFAIDGLRLAAINTPSMLTTPFSVIAGIVLGEYSVSSGWFNSETMLYMAFVTIANYTMTSFELGYALKFMRLMILTLTFLLNLPGFLLGTAIALLSLIFNRTIAGKSYIYPLIPFRPGELKKRLLRTRLPHVRREDSRTDSRPYDG